MKQALRCGLFVLVCGLLATSQLNAGGDCYCREGLTPGYWKNHVEDWPDTICPTTSIGCVFHCVDAKLADKTLLQALSFRGGETLVGAQEILLRAAVAALLNSETLCYPLSTCEVLYVVDDALCSGDRDYILYVAGVLDEYNNLGAP